VNRPSRILAAVDFSPAARAAFDRALAFSRLQGAELMVVHAVPANQPFRWRARERVALIASLRETAESSGVRFRVSVQHGDPAGVILLHARSRRPDLIVVGTHQRTGLDRLRIGSVAERVALHAAQPVLVVPERGATDTARPFQSIVVAVDFGDASTRAIEQAVALAGHTNGRLTVVHVVPGSSTGVPRHLYRYGLAEYQQRLTLDAWRRLQAAVPRGATAAAQVHARVVTGDPSTEIARIAAEIHADLIVVGVTQRGAISRKVFGATAARVMRVAEQPVIAVPEIVPPGPVAGDADALPAAA
jgi:nucleotide-binding universal stress UspA family protein